MANLGRVIYLTEAQKNELFAQGSVSSNGTTITYNQNDIYITPDKSIDTIYLNGSAKSVVNGSVDLGTVLTPASGKANNSLIAPVETTTTASQLYNVGDPFIYNDQLYQASATIPTSTTITPNTNCDSTSLIDYIKNTCVTKGGTLTGAEQIAIQKALGIYDPPWELIREDTFTNAEEADHIITVDGNGDTFELTDIVMRFETPQQETIAAKGTYGQIWFYYNNEANYFAPEPGAWTQAANSDARGFYINIEHHNNMVFVAASGTTTITNSGNVRWRYTYSEASSGMFIPSNELIITKINIKTVTGTGHYKLYGKRKWT